MRLDRPAQEIRNHRFRKIVGAVLSGCILLSIVIYPQKASAAAVQLSPASTSRFHVIDISHYNSVDWSSLPVGGTDGLSAVYMKATEGRSYTDPMISSEVSGATSRGLQYGFYAYFHPESDQSAVEQEASHFYSVIRQYPYTCFPALDVEETNGQSNATIVQSIHTFLDTFKSLSGLDMLIYASPSFINTHFQNDSTLAQHRLWLANYGGAYLYPETPHSLGAVSFDPVNIWSTWDMWQYSENMIITGADDFVDGDWATSGIFINTPSAQSSIDYATTGDNHTDDLTVIGWELSRSGVSRVDFYLDNFQWAGSTSSLYARPDVQRFVNPYGYYMNPDKCGFTYTIDTSALMDGQHTVYVAAVSNDGTAKWSSRTFYSKDGAITDMDYPNTTRTYYGSVAVTGWMLNRSGQKRVDYYLDDFKWLGSNMGNFTKRPDVQFAMKKSGCDYSDALNSGYYTVFSSSAFTPGSHTLWVAGIGQNGMAQWTSRTFNIALSHTCVDIPSGTVSGNVQVAGWALEHAGIKRVDVYLDIFTSGQKFYSTSQPLSRSDVHRAIDPSSLYANSWNSGYSLTIPKSDLTAGNHSVSVAAIGNDGSVQWVIRNFRYQ